MDPRLLARLYDWNTRALGRNLDGISHAESLVRPRPGRQCLNWVVGHILAGRDELLGLLDAERLLDPHEAALYARGSVLGEAALAVPFARLRRLVAESQRRITPALAALPPAACTAPTAHGLPGETLGEQIAFLHFREAYHVGQTGLLRRLLGKEGAIA